MMVFFKVWRWNSKIRFYGNIVVKIDICKWLVFYFKCINDFFELVMFDLGLIEVGIYDWFKYFYSIVFLVKWGFVF